MKKFFKFCKNIFLFSVFSICVPLFAEVKIVSPASSQSHVWANRQVLVIEVTQEEEVYYSFTGEDPLASGLAYDEPVFLDVAGDVELRVTGIDKNKNRTDYVLKYTVDETKEQNLTTIEEKEFIKSMSLSPIKTIFCGDEFFIPESFSYSITSNVEKQEMEVGRSVSVNKNSNLERYISLTLSSKTGDFWNYVIHSVPNTTGEYTKQIVPFEIQQWSKIYLKDKKFIYSVDDGLWQGAGKTIDIDRKTFHTIKWQNVEYDSLNLIYSYTIPPAPVLEKKLQENSTLLITFNGDSSYKFAKSKVNLSTCLSSGLHDHILVDCFQGENLSFLMPVDVYSENVLQGTLYVSFEINRHSPNAPVVHLSDESKVARQDVSFYFTTSKDEHNVKYYIDGPYYLSKKQVIEGSNFSDIDFSTATFESYDNSKIKLVAKNDQPTFYRIYYYSVDTWNNVSQLKCQNININKCDYFVDAERSVENADGTFEKPFSDLSNIEKIVSKNSYSRFYIYGTCSFPKSKVLLKSNVSIFGQNNAKLMFAETSSVNVIHSTLELNDVAITSLYPESDSVYTLFKLEHAMLAINNSELSMNRNKNANLIDASKSILSIKNSGLVAISNDYANLISGTNAKINIKSSRLFTSAPTTVNISVKKSDLNLSKSNCSVAGLRARIVELYTSYAKIFENNFEAKELQTKNDFIWKDSKSVCDEFANKVTGF